MGLRGGRGGKKTCIHEGGQNRDGWRGIYLQLL